jgi:hypothetical protein
LVLSSLNVRRGLTAAIAAATVACSRPSAPTPSSLLIGTWSSSAASLTGGPVAAGLVLPCLTVQFKSLRLNDSLRFEAVGIITGARPPANRRRGDPFPLTGEVVGSRVVIRYAFLLQSAEADTLAPGHRDVAWCPA